MGGNGQRHGKLKDIINVSSSEAAGTMKNKLDDATIDIGALMRRALQAPKLRTTGETPIGPSRTASAWHRADSKLPADGPDVELRGNPIYSPDDSLQKAASKLASLKAPCDSRKPAAPGRAVPTAAKAVQAKPAPAAAVPRLLTLLADRQSTPAPQPADSPVLDEQQQRKSRPSDAATPGWRPEGHEAHKAVSDEVPLAARTLITKRNRRKSVYQRPSRYGDWWSGNDDELDQMVDDYNEDEVAEAAAAAAAEEECKRQERKDKAARRKSAFPALARAQPSAAAVEGAEQEDNAAAAGSAIADKVRAIADGLCERLDGLIEESPKEKGRRRRAAEDDKTLRDKLLESWEGRSYYDRLLQLAGTPAKLDAAGQAEEQKPEAAEKQEQAAAAEEEHSAGLEDRQHLRRKETLPESVSPAAKQRSRPVADRHAKLQAEPAPAHPSPPKAKPALAPLKVGLPPLPDLAPRPLSTTAARHIKQADKVASADTLDTTRGLLKISGRGGKPMPAPWQSDSPDHSAPSGDGDYVEPATTAQPALKAAHASPPAIPTQAKAAVEAAADHRSAERELRAELEAARQALAAAAAENEGLAAELAAAKAQADAERQAAAQLREDLEAADAECRSQAEAAAASEKHAHALEAEVEELRAKAAVAGAYAKTLSKVAEQAAEVEGRFGLAEVQAEALLRAAEALMQHVGQGRGQAAEVVELATVKSGEEGAPGRKARSRRKSTWR